MRKTGLRNDDVYNEDVFRVLFDYEVSRARRYPSPISLLQIEMSPVAFTEESLSVAPLVFVATLNNHLRSVDITCRCGNVFKVLLPSTDETGVRIVCERILSVFRTKFDSPNGISVAFSLQIGAVFHGGGATMSSIGLLEKAGEALLQSKSKGANTFVVLG